MVGGTGVGLGVGGSGVGVDVGGTGVGVAAGTPHPTKSNATNVTPIIACNTFRLFIVSAPFSAQGDCAQLLLCQLSLNQTPVDLPPKSS
jgi:hypothetical protein